ncbi:MAG TPA: hypothetical protein VF723_15135 [Pyrinomonadaceae bacterium]|jgi:hypothetical protein
MKRCPACQRTYTDNDLSFCLEDGTALVNAGPGSESPSGFDPNATLAFNTARETNPPPVEIYNPGPALPERPAPTPSWGQQQQQPYAPAAPPARKTSATPWIIGAIAAVVVLGIGIVVLLSIAGSSNDSNQNNSNRVVNQNNANRNSNSSVVNANNSNAVNTNGMANTSSSTSTEPASLSDDFSVQKWPTGTAAYGSFYQDGEYHMKARPNLYVYMFPLNVAAYTTKDASVKVTARSVDGKSPEYGYGLIVHGKVDAKSSLEGYGFLIYTGTSPMYEIVRFNGGEPTPIVKWTQSSVIRSGTYPNQIEVRTQGTQLSLYINGQSVKSITDTANFTEGYVGLYTSETNEVAFDDMEIERQASTTP